MLILSLRTPGAPEGDVLICANAASCWCAEKMKNAMRISIGLANNSDNAEDQGQRLANPGRDVRRAAVRQGPAPATRAAPPAVHRKGRDEIEQHQPDVHGSQLGQHGNSRLIEPFEVFPLQMLAERKDQPPRRSRRSPADRRAQRSVPATDCPASVPAAPRRQWAGA